MDNVKPTPINWDISAMQTPAKDKLSAIKAYEDLIKVALGKDDAVKMWQDIVKGYDSKGLQDAIKEDNEQLAKK
ncbi:hypothetical protein [Paenibacillus sp. MBLB4367]|uniref:hypothetical protein n=1 Tax=Paenibacillus sp. MBLB4367 TaxID=3384767 RepID=UPI0039083BE8